MFLTIYKLESRLERLEELRYHGLQEIFPLTAYDDLRDKDMVAQLPAVKGEEFLIQKNDFITGRDRYIWAEKSVFVPKTLEGFDTLALFDLGKTCEGFTDGFESLIYVNDKPYQGVDSYHNEVFFKSEHAEKNVELKLLIWSGLEGGGAHKDQIMHAQKAAVGYIHRATDELYHLSVAITKTYHLLQDTNPIKAKILKALNDAFMSIDLYADKEEFYPQVELAYATLLDTLEAMGKEHDVTVYCIGHSHIDVAWLWRIKHTKEKCLRSFSTVLRLMEKFEDYQFLQSQPQLYDYVKKYYPATYEEIRQRIADGKFEPNGGMWVEADCNLISGESMARQFLYGEKFFKEEFGKTSNCLWLPDVFGYSQAMPQVLKLCDINTFMTTKISWNEYNKIPHDTFQWRGIDGSEVLTHFITAPNEDNPDHYTYFTYNGFMEPVTIHGTWDNYKDKELSSDVAISYGYGDGGGGPDRQMLMARRAMDKIPGLPHVKTISAAAYFDKLHENVSQSKGYLHTWVGELYFENHRGTYTSQAHNKRMNRKLEYAAVATELLGCIAMTNGTEYQSTEEAWKLLLVNQFHDIIPGSSITEVYDDSRIDYSDCQAQLRAIAESYETSLVSEKENTYTVFNKTAFTGVQLVNVPQQRVGYFTDHEGKVCAAEKTQNGYAVEAPLRPLGFTTLLFVEDVKATSENSSFVVDTKTKEVETPYYTLAFNENGLITKLFDKKNNRSVIRGFANRLTAYEDIPIQFDAWNVDFDHLSKYEIIDNLTGFEVLHNSTLSLSLKLTFAYRKSKIEQIIRLYKNSPRIDFETNADWHEQHKFVKACFDLDIFTSKATFDIQFGNVERNTHHSTSWDWAKFEVCAHKWVDVSETGYGVSLLNDCKYGHSVKDSLLSISLIKCATWPDTTADQGAHSFVYALYPHAGTWIDAQTQRESELLNQPAEVYQGVVSMGDKSLFTISADHISVDTVKLSEDGQSLILRLHEFTGARGGFTITSDFEIQSYQAVNILENPLGEVVASSTIVDTIQPYQIKNYRISLAPCEVAQG